MGLPPEREIRDLILSYMERYSHSPMKYPYATVWEDEDDTRGWDFSVHSKLEDADYDAKSLNDDEDHYGEVTVIDLLDQESSHRQAIDSELGITRAEADELVVKARVRQNVSDIDRMLRLRP